MKRILVVAALSLALASCSSKSTGSGTTTTSAGSTGNTGTSATTGAPVTTGAPTTAAAPAGRQVKGTTATLGAGTFTGGKDVTVGLYDVTAGAGQSGNFQVSGTDSYNEILGGDPTMGAVPTVRTTISNGDQISISGLSSVTFTPVTAPYSTSHTTTNIYAGTWTVGQDIGAGRYLATPGAGQSGNFQVSGPDSYNEILGGGSAAGGVPSVAVTLSKGDVIAISGLAQVTMTAQ